MIRYIFTTIITFMMLCSCSVFKHYKLNRSADNEADTALYTSSIFNLNPDESDRITIDENTEVELVIRIGRMYEESFRITTRHNICKLIATEGYMAINDTIVPRQHEFQTTLNNEQINTINYLLSNIENKLHADSSDYYVTDIHDALMYVNGRQILYISSFDFPQNMCAPYSDNPYLNELIAYLLKLSPVKFKLRGLA